MRPHRVRTSRRLTPDVLTGIRWGLSGAFVVVFVGYCVRYGVPFDRGGLLIWIAVGVAVFSFGRRSTLSVVLDFLPLALVLIAYDYLRGLSDRLGMPTWWYPQRDVDRFLFAGHEPTVWLQEHLKFRHTQWYDVVVCLCYFSFFFLPYVTAGVLWLRSRRDFYRWTGRFVALSFVGFGLFALIPSAPPWAAARCTPLDVAGHPNDPACLGNGYPIGDGLLGHYSGGRPGTFPFVERIAARGFSDLHVEVARQLWTGGFDVADPVAAVPSLHLGGTMLFVLFMWPRLGRRWRPVLVAYPLLMAFSLVYSGEHYVADCLAGALVAAAVHLVANRIEKRRFDTLKAPSTPSKSQESPCPPPRTPTSSPSAAPAAPAVDSIRPSATTPSSTSASDAGSSSPPARSTAGPGRRGTTVRSASS